MVAQKLYLIFYCVLILFSFGKTSCNKIVQKKVIAQNARSYLKKLAQENNFSGGVLIAQGDKIIFKRSYGFADRQHGVKNKSDTKFKIASITKCFTGIAILQLHEQGLLSLTDQLSKYIPDYPDGDLITIHHLLTHSSGIIDISSFPDDTPMERSSPNTFNAILEWVKATPLQFDPGTDFAYSNVNYLLLAFIIELVSQTSYENFIHEHIFAPCGMENSGVDHHAKIIHNKASGYTVDEDEIINAPYVNMMVHEGSGNLYSTVEDLHHFNQCLYSDSLLSKKSKQCIFSKHVAIDSDPTTAWYGYGWGVTEFQGHRLVGHMGVVDGFACELRRYVDDDIVIIILSNYEHTQTHQMSNDLSSIIFGQPVT